MLNKRRRFWVGMVSFCLGVFVLVGLAIATIVPLGSQTLDTGDIADGPVEIVGIRVTSGTEVAAGDVLFTVVDGQELRDVPSPFSGEILEVDVALGDTVAPGDSLLRHETGLWGLNPGGIDLGIWLLFAIAYFILSFRSVEVNDRMFASSTHMVVLTAGMVFAARDQAPLFALAAMAALGPFDRGVIRDRRVFLPAFNFGQLVVSAAAAAVVLETLIPSFDEIFTNGSLDVTTAEILQIVFAAAAGALTYSLVNTLAVSLGARIVYGNRSLVPWSKMGQLLLSQIAMGALGGMLGIVVMDRTLTIPLVLAVFVIGHLVFTSHAKLREAHESTLKGFILALEARDLYTRGHTERVAYFCRLIGEQLAFTGTQLERMRWAAIIHDMGKLAVPVEIMEKRGRLTDDEYRSLRRATHRVDDLLSDVDFLRPMVVICSGSHPRLPDEDFGQVGHKHTTTPSLEQKVLAVADAFDAMTSTRGYRMAMSHTRALAALREDESALFDDDVVEALSAGLDEVGETYGPPEIRLEDASPETADA